MSVCGIVGKNPEQKEMIKTILDKDIDLIIVNGALGSGKTLLSLACALHLHERGKVDSIIISNPGQCTKRQNKGHLPGTERDKLDPFLGGFYCAAEEIDRDNGYGNSARELVAGTNDRYPVIKAKELAYLKGSSFAFTLMILDEAQDADLSELRQFIGRASRGTKVIIMGDPKQLADERINGLTALINYVENMKKQPDFIKVVTLTQVERSRLAEFADKLGE